MNGHIVGGVADPAISESGITDPAYSSRRGFTVLELLVVMAIIAILAGLGATGYGLARRQAKESRAKAQLETLRTALDEYRVEFGSYPGTGHDGPIGELAAAELDFLTNAVDGVELIDPWGRAYQYRHAGGLQNRFLYKVWSEGQDSESNEDDIDPSRAGY
jgi:general secretion pathway protein G